MNKITLSITINDHEFKEETEFTDAEQFMTAYSLVIQSMQREGFGAIIDMLRRKPDGTT